jgi:hypothetical protein
MATYTFTTSLLSAEKTGNPNLVGTTLTSNGVTILTLSTNDVGIAFNPVSPLSAFSSSQITAFATPSLSAAALTAVGLLSSGPLSALPALTASRINVLGTTMLINTAYAGKTFAVIKTPMVNRVVAPFVHLSFAQLSGVNSLSTTSLAVSSVSATTTDAQTSETIRKHLLGYY